MAGPGKSMMWEACRPQRRQKGRLPDIWPGNDAATLATGTQPTDKLSLVAGIRDVLAAVEVGLVVVLMICAVTPVSRRIERCCIG